MANNSADLPVIDTSVPRAVEVSDLKTEIASAADYFELLKPRVMSLVVFTSLIGMIMAPSGAGGGVHPVIAFTALLLIALGAGASGALNMWYDADIDANMERTRTRPIPSGRIAKESVLGFGLTLSAGSVMCLGVFVNWLSAGLLAFTIFFYAVIYTIWLKRHTAQNIVIGGAAGAFPPVVGWAAVTGSLETLPVLMFAIIFFWTPPHFWALALLKNKDYIDNNIPMMPAVAGSKNTRIQIFAYALIMAIFAALPALLGYAGLFYALFSTALSTLFIAMSFWLLIAPDERQAAAAKALFAYSIFYLFLLFAGFPADKLIGI